MAAYNYGKFLQILFRPLEHQRRPDPYGPTTRPPQNFDWKLAALKKAGFDAMMFHDDDAVPDIDGKSDAQIRKETKELKKKLDDAGVAAEMVAPRLWFSPNTIDGAYTSNDPKHRQYAIERSLRCIDIANLLGTNLIVLWLAREGTYLRESKSGRRSVDLLVAGAGQNAGPRQKSPAGHRAQAQRTDGPCLSPNHRPRAGHRAIDTRSQAGRMRDRKRPRHSGRVGPGGRDRFCHELWQTVVAAFE